MPWAAFDETAAAAAVAVADDDDDDDAGGLRGHHSRAVVRVRTPAIVDTVVQATADALAKPDEHVVGHSSFGRRLVSSQQTQLRCLSCPMPAARSD